MSSVSFMAKLLDGVVVEWKALGEVLHMRAGQHISASNIMQEPDEHYVYPCFGGNGIRGFVKKNSHDGAHLLIGRQGALCGNVQRTRGKFYATEHAVVVTAKDCIDIDWAFHVLTLMNLNQYASQSAQPGLAVGKIENLEIPIPCPDNPKKSLEIQAEIVRILDAFTKLTAELTAELTARKKQYNYYRDQLLSFEEGKVVWKMLGGVAEFRRGTAITQKQTTVGDIPVVANGPTPTYLHGESNREGETIVIARSGAYAGYVSFWNQPIFLTDAFSVHPDSKILKSKFVYHFLQNKQEHIHTMKKGAGVPHVRVKEFELYDIPIPSLDEQARIVAILDKFDTLTNSLTEGLPREIELRQKQYAYYRDLLLNFPKPEEVAA
ncbi:type I restriction enzyme, S subunit [Nitrosomonas ureae]|uniref:Type I restriction enzyme, S subunit n=1 Tax=Nitrosomonas ureae TaxID=44577 RepID=A0A285BZD4_9PROT|nr:restriction endonuclease subunit S [Nitrosomonas ureae]SNX60632.1 type I restriction enzyme, S subunit [Nitrosomonas ureae]